MVAVLFVMVVGLLLESQAAVLAREVRAGDAPVEGVVDLGVAGTYLASLVRYSYKATSSVAFDLDDGDLADVLIGRRLVRLSSSLLRQSLPRSSRRAAATCCS